MKMKRCAVVLLLILPVLSLPAEAVWTGNAAVGTPDDFPGTSASYRAASNTFPPGTALKIINPRNEKSVEVVVTRRLEAPGVFIMLEQPAARMVTLSDKSVMPLRVIPVEESSADSSVQLTLLTGADAASEDAASEHAAEFPADSEENAAETEAPFSAPAGEELPAGGEPADSGPVPEELPAAVEETEKIQFFLMPSELRPPQAAEKNSPSASEKSVEEIDAELAELAKEIEAELAEEKEAAASADVYGNNTMRGNRYVQIGAYRNKAVLKQTMLNLQDKSPSYPISFDEDKTANGILYKLFVGPLRPAEMGVVLSTVRSWGFADAFFYTAP